MTHRFIGTLLGLFVLLCGCETRSERSLVVSDSTLVEVLADLHLADARSRLPGMPAGLRDSVLISHGMDSVSFRQAMTPFEDHPEDLVNLYNSVLDRLNAARIQ
jgi:hypothetical protein